MMKQMLVLVATAGAFALNAGTITVHPKATDEALINPGMGLVHYAYSSRIWAYDTGLEPGDTLDDLIPGTSVVYMRLPWSSSSRGRKSRRTARHSRMASPRPTQSCTESNTDLNFEVVFGMLPAYGEKGEKV